MVISDQTNTDQFHTCSDAANNLTQACSTRALDTLPVPSPSTSPANDHLQHESSREFFASRESFASEDSFYVNTTPRNSVPSSPRSPAEAHTPQQHFVNALGSPPRESISSPRTPSATSKSGSESRGGATCVVCMDQPNDIVLAPCQHSHCCLTCFRRTQLNACPICRTTVRSVILLSTRVELPVSLVLQRPVTERRGTARASVTFGEPQLYETVRYERPRPLITRSSVPVITSFLREETLSIQSTSVSSVSVARQAESSVRPRPRSQEAAFRRLRETGSVHVQSELSHHCTDAVNRRHTLSTRSPMASPDGPMTYPNSPRAPPLRECENIVLLGHDRKLMMSLAQKLIAAFPPTLNTGRQSHLRDKSTFVVNGNALRLVIIECDPHNTGPDLALRVQRQSPKLVLMCADFFNVSSFESIVRLDMEVLDYLNLPCTWGLIKSLRLKRPRRSHSVEEADVSAAKHFLSSRRRCFLITVDVAQETTTMRKLGYYLHKAAFKGSPSVVSDSLLSNEHLVSPRRSWSFLCLRIDLPPKQNRFRHWFRQSSINFGNCLR